MKTFSEKLETRSFMSFERSVVADRCQAQNDAIITELCKLTYLKSLQIQNHWIRVLSGIIVKYSKDKLKSGKFDYSWFFEGKGCVDRDMALSYINTIDEKYENITPSFNEMDPMRLANNVNDFRFKLNETSMRLKRVLTTQEVQDIIYNLDIYKE